MTFTGDIIKHFRTVKGITQEKLAKKCGLSSAQYISSCEKGKILVSIPIAKKICKALDITKPDLMKQAYVADVFDIAVKKWDEKPSIGTKGIK